MINAQCSWIVSNGKSVSATILWADGNESSDLEEEVMVENCVMLEAPEKNEAAYPTVPACQLLLSCQPPIQISKMSVLCEARVMEVYGHHGEYIKTIKNELVEETEDLVVFRGDIILDRPLSLCSIKFACLRTPTEMWLYGVKIHKNKSEAALQNQMSVPLDAVEQRLAQMGLALSDKAEAFKQLVERCQNSNVISPLDIAAFIANLQQSNLVKMKSPSPEKAPHFTQSTESLTKCIERRDSQNNLKDYVKTETSVGKELIQNSPALYYVTSAATSPFSHQSTDNSTQTDEYIDLEEKISTMMKDSIVEIESLLWGKISQKFQELEAKLICKLDEIESIVKPQGVGSC